MFLPNVIPRDDQLLLEKTRFAAFHAPAAIRLGLLQTGSESIKLAQVSLNSNVGL
ncbi:hypothetical protein SynBMKMC1_02902 [Synechococcus sp. BMK-MC-1]|nr:hypothetical protein SynBMKMC1_02902 [Synechococcus sp. BMK-MC-1]